MLSLTALTLIAVGFFALCWPVALNDYDRWGFRIHCGSGLVADYAQAATADHDVSASEGRLQRDDDGDHVAACRSANWWRRTWAVLLAVGGASGLIALLLAGRRWPAVEASDR